MKPYNIQTITSPRHTESNPLFPLPVLGSSSVSRGTDSLKDPNWEHQVSLFLGRV